MDPLPPPRDIIEDLADALHVCDLARLAQFPRALMLRRDACVPSRTKPMRAAPLACAINYALNALEAHHQYDARMWIIIAAGAAPSPSAMAHQLVDASPAFAVLDWYLRHFPELIDAPLDSIAVPFDAFMFGAAAGAAAAGIHRLSPLLRTLVSLVRPLEALAVLERLLRRGVRIEPPPPGANRSPFYQDLDLSRESAPCASRWTRRPSTAAPTPSACSSTQARASHPASL